MCLPAAAVDGHASLMMALAPPDQGRGWRFQDAKVLGSRFHMIVATEREDCAKAAALAARAEIDRLEPILNGRRPGAELHEFSRSSGAAVSDDLGAVLAAAERWRAVTQGAYDGRLGAVLALWRQGSPSPEALADALRASSAPLAFDGRGRVGKPCDMRLALDGLAKGYIVDRALEAARAAAPQAQGLAVDIGGDLRCWGAPPQGGLWPVSLASDDGAEPPAVVHLADAAIATSGAGPRDRRVGARRLSSTISPFDGRPVGTRSASVVAPCAADADALATAFMVMGPQRAVALADSLPGVAARVVGADGRPAASRLWRALAPGPQARLVKAAAPRRSSLPPEMRWPADWAVEMTYVAPDKQEVRNPDFRTPYMALWISDAGNRPVRTVIMVGKEAKYHRDNFIWWASYKGQTERMVDLRSEATAISGRYSLFWRGVDDAWSPLPVGDYILHIETSQERGKHTHRTLPLKIGRQAFETMLPMTQEGGGLRISYGLKR